MPLTKLGLQLAISTYVIVLGAVFKSGMNAYNEMSCNQEYRLWMHQKWPWLVERFYRSRERWTKTYPCWYREWDGEVMKARSEDNDESTKR